MLSSLKVDMYESFSSLLLDEPLKKVFLVTVSVLKVIINRKETHPLLSVLSRTRMQHFLPLSSTQKIYAMLPFR